MDVAIVGETSVTVDKPLSALSVHHGRPQFGAMLPPQRVHHDYIKFSRLLDKLIYKSFKKD